MPTLLMIEGFRFFFYSADRNEPPHVHVRKAGKEAKFWLEPIRPARIGRFDERDLRQLLKILEKHQEYFLERWNEHHNS